MSTDPRTGFTVRNSQSAEEWEAQRAAARQAAQPAPAPAFGNIGQGATLNQDTTGPFDPAKLGNFAYWTEHKAEILAAAVRGDLPGQTENYTTTLDH